MDRLDKFSFFALVILLAGIVFLVVQEKNRPQSEGVRRNAGQSMVDVKRYFDPNLDKKISLAKKLIVTNNLKDAERVVDELIKGFPYEAHPFMLKGDIALRRQNSIAAVSAYKRAVDLNPDYLDKKAKEFQGKKIKKTVEEAFSVIEKEIEQSGSSEVLEKNKKLMYYMLRKIAGSCG